MYEARVLACTGRKSVVTEAKSVSKNVKRGLNSEVCTSLHGTYADHFESRCPVLYSILQLACQAHRKNLTPSQFQPTSLQPTVSEPAHSSDPIGLAEQHLTLAIPVHFFAIHSTASASLICAAEWPRLLMMSLPVCVPLLKAPLGCCRCARQRSFCLGTRSGWTHSPPAAGSSSTLATSPAREALAAAAPTRKSARTSPVSASYFAQACNESLDFVVSERVSKNIPSECLISCSRIPSKSVGSVILKDAARTSLECRNPLLKKCLKLCERQRDIGVS